MTQIGLFVLGGARCFLGGQELVDLPGQRLRCALLIYLAVERKASRETIQNLFWSDRDEAKGRGALKQTVFELRRTLGEHFLESRGEEVHAHADISTDLQDFERAVESKDWAAALDHYHGDFLRGFSLPNCKPFEFWADRRRAHAARLHRTARRARIAELLACDDAHAALSIARVWVELEPLEDEAHHRLIELLAATGERSEALQQIESYERMLRAEALEPLAETKRLIERIRSGSAVAPVPHLSSDFDYRFAKSGAGAPVGEGSTGTSVTTNSDDRSNRDSRSWRRFVLGGVGAVLFLFVWMAWTAWVQPTFAARQIRRLGVLPFVNWSSMPDSTEHLSDGLTEELITALTQIDELFIPARTSAFAFKGKNADIREIGRALDVDALIQGSWRLEGTTVRVTVQLVRVRDGKNLWGKTFSAELREPFALQDRMVREIVDALAVELDAVAAARVAARPTKDLEAYDLYNRGRFFWAKRGPDDLKAAIKYFEAAIARDQAFALAYAGLADSYLMQARSFLIPNAQACVRIKPASLKAAALDSMRAEIRTTLARAFQECDKDMATAQREYLRAIELDPNYAQAHSWYAILLSIQGRSEEGVRESRIARRLEPYSPIMMLGATVTFNGAGQYDSAIVMYHRMRALDPSFPMGMNSIANAYLGSGRLEQAVALLDTALSQRRTRAVLGLSGYTHARLGHRNQALQVLQELKAMGREDAWIDIAHVYVGLGDHDRALDALERASVNPESSYFPRGLRSNPLWDPLRNDPRFVLLLKKMGVQDLRRAQAPAATAPSKSR